MAGSKSALIVLRCLQVLISLAFCVPTGLMLAALSAAAHWLNQPQQKDSWGTYSLELGASSTQQAKVAFGGAMAVVALIFCLCVLSFILSLVWLIYTASPKARSRAHCFGNHVICARYTCDMTWDILLIFFWLFMLAAVAAGLAVWNTLLAYINANSDHLFDSSTPYKSGSSSGGLPDDYIAPRPLPPGPETSGKVPASVRAVLNNARTVLIVAVVLAAIQLVSLVVTAALSSATRNTLRAEAHGEMLPITSAPKPIVGMYGQQYTKYGQPVPGECFHHTCKPGCRVP